MFFEYEPEKFVEFLLKNNLFKVLLQSFSMLLCYFKQFF